MQFSNAAGCAQQVCIAVHTLTDIGCVCRARQTRQSKLGLQVTPSDYLLLPKTEVIHLQPVNKNAHMCQGADVDQTSHFGCSDCLTLNLALTPQDAQLVAMRRMDSYQLS